MIRRVKALTVYLDLDHSNPLEEVKVWTDRWIQRLERQGWRLERMLGVRKSPVPMVPPEGHPRSKEFMQEWVVKAIFRRPLP